MLPRVKINFENGALGIVADSEDGVLGLLTTGVPVGATFALGTAYVIYGLASLAALGITGLPVGTTAATAEINVNAIGVDGDTITVKYGGLVLGVYTKTAAEANIGQVMLGIRDAIATGGTNYTVNLSGTLNVKAPLAAGSTPNGTALTIETTGTISANATAFVNGVTSVVNQNIYDFAELFYAQAGEGVELWLMAFPNTVTVTQMVSSTDVTKAIALINAAKGRIRALIIDRLPATSYVPTITNGLDADITTAIAEADLLGKWTADVKFAPVFTLLPGMYYSGNPVDLADLKQGSRNRVGILIGDTVANSNRAAMGLLAGRIASIPVQRNIGRVKDGAMKTLTAFIKNLEVEKADVSLIHDKGYITFRTWVSRAGYYFSDDPLATLATDDYNHITARRTIDKAFRIAYSAVLKLALDELPTTATGTLQATFCKSWQKDIVDAIANSMSANGELSVDQTDPNDKGVICFINPAQKPSQTSRFDISLKVRPFGYGRYINVNLGFATVTA